MRDATIQPDTGPERGKLKIFYRLSDAGEAKVKLPEISNRHCLENFAQQFPLGDMTVIADNVTDQTFAWLEQFGLGGLVRTGLGNAGSFWEAYRLALRLPDDHAAYLVENDYLHRNGSRGAMLEGLELADYVTLYDHPDKYYEGENPLISAGGEETRVMLTRSCHWKLTNSTTMTFAARVRTLRRDRLVFKNYSVGLLPKGSRLARMFHRRRVTDSFRAFRALARFRGRTVASPIPGYSTHGEVRFLSPFFLELAARDRPAVVPHDGDLG